jgi:hypothetical protein
MNEVLARIKSLIEANMAGYTVYQGFVSLPPLKYLPAITIEPVNTSIQAHSTCKDITVFTVRIKVFLDLNNYLSTSGSGDKMKSQEASIEALEDRTSKIADADTVIGTLRRNIRDNNWLFNNNLTISYSYEAIDDEYRYVVAECELEVTDTILRS